MKLVSIPANPVPEGAVVGVLKTPDELSIRFTRWPPPPSGRKGTVCIFQGRTEFIEKYFEVVRDLNARGFAVATLDWRGQGLSDRLLGQARKGHISNFAKYGIDLETFMREVVLPDCPPPLFGLANSMGAAVLMRAAAQGHRWFERLVLCAPMIKLTNIPLLPAVRALVRTMRLAGLGRIFVPGGGVACKASGPFLDNPVTSDPIRYARTAAIIEAEPALALGAPTIAWLDSAFRVMAEFANPAFPARLRQPMLIVACGRDQLVSTAATEEFGSRLRAGSHLVVPGSKHEILMEHDLFRSQFWAAFDAFVPGTSAF
ncbi:MAG TPA: alpha/beta hydrolase [Xanthobacteraceae bacterium]|nr:alpha/beta hydrolase [Xanthobacteraceae bacterium]